VKEKKKLRIVEIPGGITGRVEVGGRRKSRKSGCIHQGERGGGQQKMEISITVGYQQEKVRALKDFRLGGFQTRGGEIKKARWEEPLKTRG